MLFSNLPELNAKLPATQKGLFDDLGTKEAKEGLEDAKGDLKAMVLAQSSSANPCPRLGLIKRTSPPSS
ncbi:hypothetical protein HAL013_10470 [Helicobacter ailurogastricus]|uniref:Uncharacterized protein n=1 Tax=Helicobacter ailurogastricus TaxID=1578720 RepID=A0A0K2XAQ1_9HELI|nr:hypothetical protein HAL011_07000 [Helicobacter ailurogastricus]CRF42837.1 hypothetical protein HAL013_10470 [Helicobacter ailurogastricus]CRF44405.1 hypothetical protein HAL09_09870 [Helicobacter ailurogastricus]